MNKLNSNKDQTNFNQDDPRSKAMGTVNDIGLEDDGILKADQLIDVDPLSDEFAKEMSLIDDDDIEINQEDLNFIDNISWDTASIEDDFEDEMFENMKDANDQNSLDSDGIPKDVPGRRAQKSSNRDSEQTAERNDYNFLMHAVRNCYSKELGSHESYVHSKRFSRLKPLV